MIDDGILQGTSLIHQQVTSLSGIYKFTDAIIKLQSGYVSPFFHFQEEKKSGFSRYSVIGGGVGYQKEKKSIKVGIDRRQDSYPASLENESMDKKSEDLIASIQYLNQSRIGWRNNLILKQRLKKLDNSATSLSYLLGRIKLSYKKPDRPVQLEMNAST